MLEVKYLEQASFSSTFASRATLSRQQSNFKTPQSLTDAIIDHLAFKYIISESLSISFENHKIETSEFCTGEKFFRARYEI